MSDPRTTQGDEPTSEELQAYLEQLRGADPAEILAQAYTVLGTGAEVKLGRRDARVLIDAMSALAEAAAGAVDDDLTTRMRNGVVQLQTAQVQAERQGAGEAGQDAQQPPQPHAESSGSAQPSATPPPGGQREDKSATDRLWIPGREPR